MFSVGCNLIEIPYANAIQKKCPAQKGAKTYRAVVHHRHSVLLCINHDLESVHCRIALLVVRCVDENFVKNLVQPRHKGHRPMRHPDSSIIHPKILRLGFNRPDVRVRTQQNVLQLRELDIGSLLRGSDNVGMRIFVKIESIVSTGGSRGYLLLGRSRGLLERGWGLLKKEVQKRENDG